MTSVEQLDLKDAHLQASPLDNEEQAITNEEERSLISSTFMQFEDGIRKLLDCKNAPYYEEYKSKNFLVNYLQKYVRGFFCKHKLIQFLISTQH